MNAPQADIQPDDVLRFWFEEIRPAQWWAKDPDFDAEVARRFGALLARAARAELHAWRDTVRGRLAEVIVLDQFPRNIHRDTPAAFACDPLALALTQEAVRAGALQQLQPVERAILLLPYMHSESAAIHTLAEALYRDHAPPGEPRLRAASQGHHRPLRPLSAPQRHPRPRVHRRGSRLPAAARLRLLNSAHASAVMGTHLRAGRPPHGRSTHVPEFP